MIIIIKYYARLVTSTRWAVPYKLNRSGYQWRAPLWLLAVGTRGGNDEETAEERAYSQATFPKLAAPRGRRERRSCLWRIKIWPAVRSHCGITVTGLTKRLYLWKSQGFLLPLGSSFAFLSCLYLSLSRFFSGNLPPAIFCPLLLIKTYRSTKTHAFLSYFHSDTSQFIIRPSRIRDAYHFLIIRKVNTK